MEQPVLSYIETLQRQADDANTQLELVTWAFNLCESPIERQLLLAYLQRYPVTAHPDGKHSPLFVDVDTERGSWVSFTQQQHICLDKQMFRADFFFMRLVEDAEAQRLNVARSVVVEVDGHDFHERTKEQARKDRKRDRLMLRNGLYVLRYTGSEVFRDADAVVTEIRHFVMPSEAAA